MLQEITVKNLALIEELRLEFDAEFNVLTGETGAGKSIIIDALGLALGGRFSSEMIRAGADGVSVGAIFTLTKRDDLDHCLDELGIELDEDRTLIIQREISSNGKNRCRVNGQLVTVLSLAKIGEFLIDIHGQHQHQSLFLTEKQLELLDRYCGAELIELKDTYLKLYQEWYNLSNEYHKLQQNEADALRRSDLLRFQLDEIEKAHLVIGEDEELLKEREILSSAEKLYAAAVEAYQALYENLEGMAAIELLGAAKRSLEQVVEVDSRLKVTLSSLTEALCQTEEAARELRDYQEKIQFDPGRLNEITERLEELGRLKRKYGHTTAEVMLFAEKCAVELQILENYSVHSKKLEGKLLSLCEKMGEIGSELSKLRQLGAKRLQDAIMQQLADLNMSKSRFEIQLTQIKAEDGLIYGNQRVAFSKTGVDVIEFLVAPNPGEGLKPMGKIASGGEMSRIMLALKAILAELDQIPTMVFDEIDVGIGGRTAQAVAEKMLLIGLSRQVISVSHLPQIASMAGHHFYIEKQAMGDRTVVTVRALEESERVTELARMLSGAQVTETTKQHAQEMLNLAKELRQRG